MVTTGPSADVVGGAGVDGGFVVLDVFVPEQAAAASANAMRKKRIFTKSSVPSGEKKSCH